MASGTQAGHHRVFTIIVPVTDGEAVDEALKQIASAADEPKFAFERMPGLHYASVTLLEPLDERGVGRSLVIELNTDQPIKECIESLVELDTGALGHVMKTPGWPADGDRDAKVAFLDDEKRVHTPGAYHVGNTGRELEQIKLEARLWDSIQTFLDAEDLRGAGPSEVHRALRAMVEADPEVKAALDDDDDPRIEPEPLWKVLLTPPSLGTTLAVLVRFPWIFIRERFESPTIDLSDPPRLAEIEALEDQLHCVQNHLTSVVEIKTGMRGVSASKFRLKVLNRVLKIINAAARRVYIEGELGGIPTIHFAHWVVIDEGKRLLFVSNFDGSWESYLDDFIELAHAGLTAVWSNCVGFPRSRFLVGEGATNGEAFKRWARRTSQVTRVWYHAYPELSVAQIDVNTTIRRILAKESPNGSELEELCRLV